MSKSKRRPNSPSTRHPTAVILIEEASALPQSMFSALILLCVPLVPSPQIWDTKRIIWEHILCRVIVRNLCTQSNSAICVHRVIAQFAYKSRHVYTMAQFRFGILLLNIETGRFRNQPIEQRICNLCELYEIEDEFHVLFKCTLFI